MIRISHSIVTAICIINLLLIQGCDGDTGGDKPEYTVKVGVIAPLSGDDQRWGESGLLGVETALDIARARMGNVRIELIKIDDANSPEKAGEAFKTLVVDHQVSSVLILSGSDSTIGVAELADQYKTPIISVLSSHPDVTENQWLSQIMFDDNVQATVAALFVIDELLIRRVGIVRDSGDPHTAILADQFSRRFRDAGGEVDMIDLTGVVVDKAVDQLSRKNLEFVYLPVSAEKVIAFKKAAGMIGWNPQIMVGDGILSLIMLGYGSDVSLADGMYATDVYSNDSELTEYGKIVTSRFTEIFNKPATTITALSCEGASILFKAIEFCGKDPDKSCVNNMLRSAREFEGIFGPIIINTDGKAERSIFINRIKNKKLHNMFEVN